MLGNSEKQRPYDRFGTMGNIGDVFGNPVTSDTLEDVVRDFGGFGLGLDFLDNIFGDLPGAHNFHSRPTAWAATAPVE